MSAIRPVRVPELPNAFSGQSLPLTYNQDKYFLREALHRGLIPGTPQFHVVVGYECDSEIDPTVLETCLRQIVRRHAVLRTGFFRREGLGVPVRNRAIEQFARTRVVSSGIYCQVAFDNAELALRVEDLRDGPTAETESLVAPIRREISTPFDLAQPPLLRASLIRRTDRKQMVLICAHHLIFDHWSSLILRIELEQIYAATIHQQPFSLPRLTSQFGDFARWQRDYLKSSASTPATRFWCESWLRVEPAQFEFDDFVFAKPQSYDSQKHYSNEAVTFSEGLCSAIRKFVLRAKTTLYMYFAAVLAIALSHCTKKQQVCLWANLANRCRPGTPHLLGWFVNSYPIGIDVASDPTALELIGHTWEAVLSAMRHQEIPLLFALGHSETRRPRFGGLRIVLEGIDASRPNQRNGADSPPIFKGPVSLPYPGGDTGHTLRIVFVDSGTRIDLMATFSPQRFDSPPIAGMLDAVREIAARIVADSGLRVSAFRHCVEAAVYDSHSRGSSGPERG